MWGAVGHVVCDDEALGWGRGRCSVAALLLRTCEGEETTCTCYVCEARGAAEQQGVSTQQDRVSSVRQHIIILVSITLAITIVILYATASPPPRPLPGQRSASSPPRPVCGYW